jgi:prepilin-type N-terminal cleavage/methylation domain-containing protein
MSRNRRGFTIIETIIAFMIVALLLSAAFKILNDSIKFETDTKSRSEITLALSMMVGAEIKSKDFYLSDRVRDEFKDIDDDLRRALKQKYSYKEKYYKKFDLGDEEKKIRVQIDRCSITNSDKNHASIYKIDIK